MAFAQSFGRFGYLESIEIPGFQVDRQGFRVSHGQATKLAFEEPSKVWRPLLTSEFGQTIGLSGVGRSPSKVRFDLLGAGFSLFFQHGAGLKISSTTAPYLTWADGSVGPGVPTPATSWLLLSFRDAQPPILFAVLGDPTAFQLTGRAGDWRLKTTEPWTGWIRVAAPIGLRALATNSAAALGELKSRVVPLIKYFAGPVPKLERLEMTEEPTAVTATWTFDRPYALAPIPTVLAPLAGYPLKLESPTVRLDSTDPSGPLSALQDRTLRVRFPVRRIPTGRSLSLGAPETPPIGTVSPIDVPSVAELALANLPASRDHLTREAAEETLSRYLGDAAYETEPYTRQRLPYTADGTGIDLAAAHALLMQATITTVRATSEPNSLLTSVLWRRDWRTWRIWTPEAAISRKAGALAALAAAICPEPARRLEAAMLEAGLATETGLRIWRQRNGLDAGEKNPGAPLSGLRKAVFLYSDRSEIEEAYARSLLSEIRIYGDLSIRAYPKSGQVALAWTADSERPMTILLASAYPVEISPGTNLNNATAEEALGFTVVRCSPRSAGPCEILLKMPEWASPLPKHAETPRFTGLQALANSYNNG